MIGDVIGAMFLIVVLIVATWVAIFGGVGAMLARSYGRSAVVGLAWGTVLGPIGWLIVWLTNVRGRTSSTPARADGPSPAIGRAGDPRPAEDDVLLSDTDDWFGAES